MSFLLAAAPYEEWARERMPLLIVVSCVIMALLVVRLVVKTMTRIILLSLILMLTTFVYIERDGIQECAQSCECSLAGFDITMPACDAPADSI